MILKKIYRKLRLFIQNLLFKNSFLYKKYLGAKVNINKNLFNDIRSNVVLKNKSEIENSVTIVKKSGLPLRSDASKNWDTLIAYSEIIKNTTSDARILDAGAEIYSMILPWLFLSGYTKLFANNLVFKNKFRRGTIIYDFGDITKTNFPPNHFEVVTCLSVIEHGVDLDNFFQEMKRIINTNGLLIISTDYYETKINTEGKIEYGNRIKIFCRQEIESMIEIAKKNDFNITSDLRLASDDKPVRWERFDLDYTYICLTLKNIK